MGAKGAQRQANYREFSERYFGMLRKSLQGRTPQQAQDYQDEFQKRLDLMFTNVPQIADTWDTFVVATNEITYQMIADSPEYSQEQKDAYAAQHKAYLHKAGKNWPRVVLVLVLVVAVILAILQLAGVVKLF